MLPRPLKGAYDYAVPPGLFLQRGDIVEVPLGRTREVGVVWGPGTGEVPQAKLKPVAHRFDTGPLPADLLDFIDWVADYTLAPPGDVLALVLRVPSALEPPETRTAYVPGAHTPERLSAARKRVLQIAQDGMARRAGELAREAGVSLSVVKGLIAAGALAAVALPAFPRFPAPDPSPGSLQLSPSQEEAGAALRSRVAAGFSATLLDGVTGSGKTEVYFEAVAEALRQGGQVLILLPEIALSVQFLDRFAARFGCRPAEWHSDLSQRERRGTWRAVMTGEARAIVGARSALFLPYTDLSLIIVDEEHDNAFKQEEGLIYHARDMAVVRAKMGGFPIILSSATPSLETWLNAARGRYLHVKLPQRHGAARLPEVALIDLREEGPEPESWLSPKLVAAMEETLSGGEQVLLFLNRRGYAPLTICRACGHRLGCPNCSSWLVEHRYHARLKCHHCGYELARPQACPSCHAEGKLHACGPGVERLAEEVRARFPGRLVAIASSDVLHGPKQTQAAIEAMAEGGTDILIGTQMVAKGHNFPGLTLVGIVDADLGLAGGDPRARERTFQLLHQVSGRAGRAEKPGRVLIQTTQPDLPVMQALAAQDRDGFLAIEAEDRQANGLPPFGRLAAVIISGSDEALVHATAQELRRSAPLCEGIAVWGPAPASLSRLKGQTRVRLLVHAARNLKLSEYVRPWLACVRVPGRVRVSVDIDPVSFF
ncbi:MAG: primosomal protein N' [Alphaproteobacteria bacterium]|nr:primosomal protein N' [Alphaproteobacteria bacterium]